MTPGWWLLWAHFSHRIFLEYPSMHLCKRIGMYYYHACKLQVESKTWKLNVNNYEYFDIVNCIMCFMQHCDVSVYMLWYSYWMQVIWPQKRRLSWVWVSVECSAFLWSNFISSMYCRQHEYLTQCLYWCKISVLLIYTVHSRKCSKNYCGDVALWKTFCVG